MASTDLQSCASYHRRKAEELKISLSRHPHTRVTAYSQASIDKHEAWAGAIELALAALKEIRTWQKS